MANVVLFTNLNGSKIIYSLVWFGLIQIGHFQAHDT